ncbi:MAG TPA: hypothetical protein VGE13_03605 [Candidatus Saccharimonadales bacterium]
MKQVLRVISISQLEVVAALFLLNAIVLYITFAAFDKDGYLTQYFNTLRGEMALGDQYVLLSNQINSSGLAGNLAVACFWAAAGLLGYYLIYYIFISGRQLGEFVNDLKQKGIDKVGLIEYRFAAIGIRVGAIVGILMSLLFTQRVLLPYVLAIFNISQSTPVLDRLPELAAVVASMLLVFHVFVVLMRLATLRTRLFL